MRLIEGGIEIKLNISPWSVLVVWAGLSCLKPWCWIDSVVTLNISKANWLSRALPFFDVTWSCCLYMVSCEIQLKIIVTHINRSKAHMVTRKLWLGPFNKLNYIFMCPASNHYV